jgi:diaminopimelate decarboxylase
MIIGAMKDHLLAEIASQVGTPTYVYDAAVIAARYHALSQAMRGSVLCYAVKANGNLSILKLLNGLGAQFDVVSWGEMQRCLAAGVNPDRIVFAGVGKTAHEIEAALRAGVGWLNVESAQELRAVSDVAVKLGTRARVALRINPAVDPHTHQYLATGKGSSKFGINVEPALALVRERAAYRGVEIGGVHAHIGSQLFEVQTYADTMRILLDFVAQARAMGHAMTHVDMGGGFGVDYRDPSNQVPLAEIGEAILPMAQAAGVTVQFEPGRYIVAEAGQLLSRVVYTKDNGGTRYVVADAAMNDLIRPTLYQAYHGVRRVGVAGGSTHTSTVVGPICESGDWLAKDVPLPDLAPGDLIAFSHAGAYAMSMASNYNTRGRGAEVLVEGERWRVIRRRETVDDQLAIEREVLA